jgi:hypothetical protein
MDPKKLGLAAASLLGAATMLTAPTAGAQELIIRPPGDCKCEPSQPGGDGFLKVGIAHDNVAGLLLPAVQARASETPAAPFYKLTDAFNKVSSNFDAFSKI